MSEPVVSSPWRAGRPQRRLRLLIRQSSADQRPGDDPFKWQAGQSKRWSVSRWAQTGVLQELAGAVSAQSGTGAAITVARPLNGAIAGLSAGADPAPAGRKRPQWRSHCHLRRFRSGDPGSKAPEWFCRGSIWWICASPCRPRVSLVPSAVSTLAASPVLQRSVVVSAALQASSGGLATLKLATTLTGEVTGKAECHLTLALISSLAGTLSGSACWDSQSADGESATWSRHWQSCSHWPDPWISDTCR
jgi:hypothetical protein